MDPQIELPMDEYKQNMLQNIDVKADPNLLIDNAQNNSLNKDIENESKIKLLRKKRKFPINEEKMEYLKERQAIGIKYSLKDPEDINWKKKNINYKNTPGFDILRCLAKVYPYESIINAIIKNSKKNNTNTNKLKSMIAGLIQVNGYTNIISMLLQIEQKIKEKQKLEEEKDNISMSSGDSIKDKKYNSSSSSDSDESSYDNIPINKNDDIQTDLLSTTSFTSIKMKEKNQINSLMNSLSQLSGQSPTNSDKKNKLKPKKYLPISFS